MIKAQNKSPYISFGDYPIPRRINFDMGSDFFLMTNPLWWIVWLFMLVITSCLWLNENYARWLVLFYARFRSLKFCNESIEKVERIREGFSSFQIRHYELLKIRRDKLLSISKEEHK
jgi:hypothetical protein